MKASITLTLNSLPSGDILDISNLKATADD